MYTETDLAPLTTCGTPPVILPPHIARARVSAFKDKTKFTVLDNVMMNTVGKHAKPVYELDLDLFQGLLRKFEKKGYNGIRAYFASYPDFPNAEERRYVPTGMEGQLTLILVPTTAETGLETGVDDRRQFWHLGSDGQLIHLLEPKTVPEEKDIVTRWIRLYRQNRMHHLEQDGKSATGNPDFKETRSHWYDIRTIEGGATEEGLISFINCARQPTLDNPVIGLYYQFAAFLDTEEEPAKFPKFQLSIIFYLRQKHDPAPNKDNMFPVANPIVFGSIQSAAADTGLPCPPVTYCPGSGISPDL